MLQEASNRNEQLSQTNSTSSSKKKGNSKQTAPSTPSLCDDSAIISSFKWKRSGSDMTISTPTPVNTTRVTPSLNRISYPINLKTKLAAMTQNYKEAYQQARSPNLLIAKFSEFKGSIYRLVLTAAGMSLDDLKSIQHDAIQDAKETNIAQFEENEYNFEMMRVLTPKKSQKNLISKFLTTRKELMIHMDNLGEPDFWSPQKINTIQLEQNNLIYDSFLTEQQQLIYQKAYYYQDGHAIKQDPNILVNLSQETIDPLDDLNQKIDRLKLYLTQTETRKNQLTQELTTIHHQTIGNQTKSRANEETLNLKSKGKTV